eukprot:gene3272-3586_t
MPSSSARKGKGKSTASSSPTSTTGGSPKGEVCVSLFNIYKSSPQGLGESFRVLMESFQPSSSSPTTVNKKNDVDLQSSVNVIIPKNANIEGKPREAPRDCLDRHIECQQFYKQGECLKNPGWMIVNCPKSCNNQINACLLRDPKIRCTRQNLNMSTSPIYANGYYDNDDVNNQQRYINGDLNNMFESIIERFQDIYQVEVLSRSPWVVTFENFTTSEEGEALVGAIERWERSTDTGSMNEYGESGRVLSSGRTSSNGWCNHGCEEHPLVKQIFERIEDVTHIPRSHYESFQVLRYGLNQYYNVHHDCSASDARLACGPRILTFFLYLSDVEEGGETAFPQLGLAVRPKRGRAVLWPSTLDHNLEEVDSRTVHEARPVRKGLKLAANSWIHLYDYQNPNLWGCTGSFDEL